jgi:uncharacterized protein YijF (DUF1287 family)
VGVYKYQVEVVKMKAGDVVSTYFGGYQHLSLVSDKIGRDGMLMLISATRRMGM